MMRKVLVLLIVGMLLLVLGYFSVTTNYSTADELSESAKSATKGSEMLTDISGIDGRFVDILCDGKKDKFRLVPVNLPANRDFELEKNNIQLFQEAGYQYGAFINDKLSGDLLINHTCSLKRITLITDVDYSKIRSDDECDGYIEANIIVSADSEPIAEIRYLHGNEARMSTANMAHPGRYTVSVSYSDQLMTVCRNHFGMNGTISKQNCTDYSIEDLRAEPLVFKKCQKITSIH